MFNKNAITQLLKSKNWSRYKLCKEAHLAQSTLSDILSGKAKNPNTKTLQKIADALRVPVNEFFKEDYDYSIPALIISTLRKENNLSALELSKALKLPDNAIDDIEHDKAQLSRNILNKLSTFFNVQEDYILGKTSERHEGEIDELEKDLREAMHKLKKISPEDRKKVLQILNLFDDNKDK